MSVEQPRRSSSGSSPEFEFCMVGESSFLTADELFVDGVLRPLLHQLPHPTTTNNNESEPDSPTPTAPPPPTFHSKRWKALFKAADHIKEKRNRERKDSIGGGSAELNIHIWPFSRSRSAGNPVKPKAGAASRKTSSAPCSRSNSCGESTTTTTNTKKSSVSWVGGLQNGIHLGRSRPVWQLRRSSKTQQESATKEKSSSTCSKNGGHGVRVLNLNVNTCIGYRNNSVNCGSDHVKDGMTGDDGGGGGGGGGVNAGIFSFRTIFSKKVY